MQMGGPHAERSVRPRDETSFANEQRGVTRTEPRPCDSRRHAGEIRTRLRGAPVWLVWPSGQVTLRSSKSPFANTKPGGGAPRKPPVQA